MADDPDALVSMTDKMYSATITQNQFNNVLSDRLAWLRMKHPDGRPVFKTVSINARAVTAEAFDYNADEGATIPMNFDMVSDGTPERRYLVLRSDLRFMGVPVLRSGKLTLTITRGTSRIVVAINASPTLAARVLGGNRIQEVTADLRDVFGTWMQTEGPKAAK